MKTDLLTAAAGVLLGLACAAIIQAAGARVREPAQRHQRGGDMSEPEILATWAPCCKILRAGKTDEDVTHNGACRRLHGGRLGPTIYLVPIDEVDRLTAENAALRATVEQAWDEGYASGHNDGVCNADRHPNPYRAALAPEGAISEGAT